MARIFLPLVFLVGCAPQGRDVCKPALPTTGLSESFYLDSVRAAAIPPQGWTRDPLRKSDKHTHEVWRSRTGNTAYGVMHFSLPFPVGADLALWGFMREMRKKQGEANLISERDDAELPGIRFVADGGAYRIRANLIVSGWHGWAIYAGTLRHMPIKTDELDLAERARESTGTGKAPARSKAPPRSRAKIPI